MKSVSFVSIVATARRRLPRNALWLISFTVYKLERWAYTALAHFTIISHTHAGDNDTSTPMKGAANKIFDRNYAMVTGLLTKQQEGGNLKSSYW